MHRHQFNTGRYYDHDKGPYAYEWDGYASLPQNAPRADTLAADAAGLPSVTPSSALVILASAYHGYKASGGSKIAMAVFGALGAFAPLLGAAAVVADTARFGYATRNGSSLASVIGSASGHKAAAAPSGRKGI